MSQRRKQLTNKEYYKEQIFTIACNHEKTAITENGIVACNTINCDECELFVLGKSCAMKFREWLDKEYMPKISEAVQNAERNDVILVSNDRLLWRRAYMDYYDSYNDVVWCVGSSDNGFQYAKTVNEFMDYCLT